ncbi:cytochrome P450 [Jatrophihabitans fulvus]
MDVATAGRLVGRFFVDRTYRGEQATELFTRLPVDVPVLRIGDEVVVSDHVLIKRLAASGALSMGQADFPAQARVDNPEFVDFFSNNLFFRPRREHAALKAVLSAHFVPATVAALARPTYALTARLFDAAGDAGTVELVGEVAARLPPLVAAVLIGVPDGDHDWLAEQAAGLLCELCRSFPSTGGDDGVPIGRSGFAQLRAYLHELLTTRSAVVGSLGERLARAIHAGTVSVGDACELLVLLLMAGVDTVITGIANAMTVMLGRPDELQRVATGAVDPAAAFAEAIRLFTPVPFARRTVVEPVTVEGLSLRTGQGVLLCLAAGNRDPRAFVDPTQWNPDRGRGGTLSFGHGVYHCIGVALGTLEGAAVVAELARRFGGRDFSYAVGGWNGNLGFHSPATVTLHTRD